MRAQHVGETGEKWRALIFARPFGQNKVYELWNSDTSRARRVGLRNDHLRDVRHQRLLLAIERSERHIGQTPMQRLTKLYRRLGASRNEGQRQSSAEELNDFASSHIRTERGDDPGAEGRGSLK